MNGCCSIDTCSESTEDGKPRPAVRVVASTTIDAEGVARYELVTVCGVHAYGWYDGSDAWLPRIDLSLAEAAVALTKLHNILQDSTRPGHNRVSLCQIELDKIGVPTPWSFDAAEQVTV